MQRMSSMASRVSVLHRLALACAVLVLAITSLSAYIRLARAGLGCAPWPQCYRERAALPPAAAPSLDDRAVQAARIAHRIAASAALLLVIALLVKSLAGQPMLWRQGRLALALLAIALFLSVLGRMGDVSRAPPVVLGNLLGGLTLFALACRLVQATAPAAATRPPRLPAWLRAWTVAALVLLALQIALGGLASAQHAATECGAAGLCQLHRASGIATALVLLPLGALAWRGGARLGGALFVLALVQVALGGSVLANAAPLALALAHNVGAALLAATLVALLPARSP